MGIISVEDLKEGMVLANDLIDIRGRFLLGEGTVLEKRHLRIMNIWGISAADIKGRSQQEITQEALKKIKPEILEEAQRYVDNLFRSSTKPHEALEELKRICLIRISEKISKGKWTPSCKQHETSKLFIPNEKIIPCDELVEKRVKLTSFPDIYYQIMTVLDKPQTSASHVAEMVSKDTSLSATVLRLVNSAFYGLSSKVDSITRAVALIGIQELGMLALGISAVRFFKDIPLELVDMKNFWLHSIATGIFARLLAKSRKKVAEEVFFIGGLLHNIGSLILFKEFPHTMVHIIDRSYHENTSIFQIENEILGYDHAKVAALFMEKWNFPQELIKMIQYQQFPLVSRVPINSAIVVIASIMATALGYGGTTKPCVPPFEKKVWDILELSISIVSSTIKQADRQVDEIFQVFHFNESNSDDKEINPKQ